MSNLSNEQIGQMIIDGAKKRGIKDSKAVVGESRSVSVIFRKGIPDKVEDSSRRSVSVTLYDNGKYSSSTSNDFRKEALESFLDSAVAMTKAMVPDPFREITDPKLYEGREDIDLELYDENVEKFTGSMRNEAALEAEQAALSAAGDKALSAESSMETSIGSSYKIHSNGFSGKEKGSQIWLYTEISLKDEGNKRPSGWEISGGRFVTELGSPKDVGIGAVKQASLKLGTQKISTRKCPMIVENRTAGRLLGGLLGATSGRALQQKSSFLDGMKDKTAGSSLLTITDSPFIKRGLGSRLYDSEGISARPMAVFENGVFKNFYVDTYYAKKLQVPPTFGGSSNLIFTPGQKSLEELAAEINNGILVRGFIGGNTNGTTGDFSLGVYGTLIENGVITTPVSELNISGNHKELWHKLAAVGNDPWKLSSKQIPSLVFDEIQFSGN
ncbi:MAG: TldD/PmbA family protein [Deltaproteobacteria bacterium]|nr:TldD/PmbA family protein [Deltaproteobacteria bacterium]